VNLGLERLQAAASNDGTDNRRLEILESENSEHGTRNAVVDRHADTQQPCRSRDMWLGGASSTRLVVGDGWARRQRKPLTVKCFVRDVTVI